MKEAPDKAGLPLPTLLSQVLVAFTIEFDNEFENQMPHRTTASRSGDGPWLASLVMFSNFLQYVPQEGATVREIESLARTANLPLAGMERWGYVVVAPDPADGRPKPPHHDWVVHPTAKGKRAQEVWRPLFGVIERRWQERFGNDEIDRLKASLLALTNRFEFDLPDFLPILGYGLVAKVGSPERRASAEIPLSLPALLSQVLLSFTLEFERESELSLAISANVLRPLNGEGVALRDLPRLSGVSKEAIQVSVNFLEKGLYVVVESVPTEKGKRVRLTQKGLKARDSYLQLLNDTEGRWKTRHGEEGICDLRESLELLVGEPTSELSPLFLGLEPYPEGWRASVRKPATLPHYPMVLHRGGYPDGS